MLKHQVSPFFLYNILDFVILRTCNKKVGELRWRAPVPKKPWAPQLLNAQKYGVGCPQFCNLPPFVCPTNTSEDCLTLNVWAPVEPGKYPVLVFIPGGRFEQGTSGTILYDSSILVNSAKIIVVSINYRLGVLGWLYDGKGISGNYGLMVRVH